MIGRRSPLGNNRPQATRSEPGRAGRYLVVGLQRLPYAVHAEGEPDLTRMLSGHPQNVPVKAAPGLPLQGGWIVAINETNTAWVDVGRLVHVESHWIESRESARGPSSSSCVDTKRKSRAPAGNGRRCRGALRQASDDDLKAIYAYSERFPRSPIGCPTHCHRLRNRLRSSAQASACASQRFLSGRP